MLTWSRHFLSIFNPLHPSLDSRDIFSLPNEPSFCQGPLDPLTWMGGTCLPSKQAWFLTNCACHRSDILGIVKHKEMPPHLLGDSLPLPFHFKRRAYFNLGRADPSCLSFMIGGRFVVIAELSICRDMKFSFNPRQRGRVRENSPLAWRFVFASTTS